MLRFILSTPEECTARMHGFFTQIRCTNCPTLLSISPLADAHFDTLSDILACDAEFMVNVGHDPVVEVGVLREPFIGTMLVMPDQFRRRVAVQSKRVGDKASPLYRFIVPPGAPRRLEHAIREFRANEGGDLRIPVRASTRLLISSGPRQPVRTLKTIFVDLPLLDPQDPAFDQMESPFGFLDEVLGAAFLERLKQGGGSGGHTTMYVYDEALVVPAEQMHAELGVHEEYFFMARHVPTNDLVLMIKRDKGTMMTFILADRLQ